MRLISKLAVMGFAACAIVAGGPALAQQKPLMDVSTAERLKQFKQFFGDDLTSFENDFLRFMRGVN